MIMRANMAARMAKFARRALILVLDNAKRARHAQMHQEHIARSKIGKQVLGATAETGHGLTLKPRNKILLERKPQVFAPGVRFDNFRSLHHGLQAAADGLDFGQFGHGWAFIRSASSKSVPGFASDRAPNR